MTLTEFEEYLKTCANNYGELRDKSRELIHLMVKKDFSEIPSEIIDAHKESSENYASMAYAYQDILDLFKKVEIKK